MLSVAVLMTAATFVLFGVFPAWSATRTDAGVALSIGRSGRQMSTLRSMRPLVAAQLAMSFVLVMGAALFGRTLVSFARLENGFDPAGIVEVTLDPVISGYTREEMPALTDRILAALRGVPGVSSAAFSFCSLGANCSSAYRVPTTPAGEMRGVSLHNEWVGPDYFATLGITRTSGRAFTVRDTPTAPRVAIVSESLARQYFPGEDAVGKRLGYQKFDLEIVGVVGDVRPANRRDMPGPVVYLPIAQPTGFIVPASTLDVRVSGDAGVAMLSIRDAIRRAEPGLFVEGVRTMDQRLDRALLRERLVAYLSWALGALALFLASIGLYGVLSYAVTGRRKEIGIRTALGAGPATLSRMILRDAATIIVPGIVAGAVAARFAGRLVESLLFGVTALDLPTFVVVIGILSMAAVAAVLAPARRAASLDPVRALRTE
jgi:predicted permease